MSGGSIVTFVEEDYFTVYKWDVQTEMQMMQDAHFLLASVIEGEGTLYTEDGEYAMQKGDHFILPHDVDSFRIKGTLQLIASHPNHKGGQHLELENTARQMANI